MFKKNYLFLFVYFLTFCFLIIGIFYFDSRMIFICLLTLILFFFIEYLEKLFRIELSFLLKLILVLFIFSAQVLGEVFGFYKTLPFWDNILHFIAGFVSACFGFSILYYWVFKCNKEKSFVFINVIFMICFSVFISVIWEFFEFSMDRYLGFDMQKDTYIERIDTSFFEIQNDNIITFDDILYVDIYYQDDAYRLYDGYLDIGLIDTIGDMFFNVVGAFLLGIFYLISSFMGSFKIFNLFWVKKSS